MFTGIFEIAKHFPRIQIIRLVCCRLNKYLKHIKPIDKFVKCEIELKKIPNNFTSPAITGSARCCVYILFMKNISRKIIFNQTQLVLRRRICEFSSESFIAPTKSRQKENQKSF